MLTARMIVPGAAAPGELPGELRLEKVTRRLATGMSCRWQQSKNISYVLGLYFLREMHILLPVGRNIDSCNYMDVLHANLWPFVCRHFVGKHFFSQGDSPYTSLSIY